MITTTINIADTATPDLRRIASQLKNPQAFYKDVGREGARALKRHYASVDSARPNRLGGKRTHYWLDIRDSVQQPENIPGGVQIAINHPTLAAKVYGAIITPKRASALTIPIHRLAYGRRASTFEDETGAKLFRPKGKRILMADIDGSGEAVPIYYLAKRVTVRPDADALPDMTVFSSLLVARGEKHLARMLAREAATS